MFVCVCLCVRPLLHLPCLLYRHSCSRPLFCVLSSVFEPSFANVFPGSVCLSVCPQVCLSVCLLLLIFPALFLSFSLTLSLLSGSHLSHTSLPLLPLIVFLHLSHTQGKTTAHCHLIPIVFCSHGSRFNTMVSSSFLTRLQLLPANL